jgi:hypothetical protein
VPAVNGPDGVLTIVDAKVSNPENQFRPVSDKTKNEFA